MFSLDSGSNNPGDVNVCQRVKAIESNDLTTTISSQRSLTPKVLPVYCNQQLRNAASSNQQSVNTSGGSLIPTLGNNDNDERKTAISPPGTHATSSGCGQRRVRSLSMVERHSPVPDCSDAVSTGQVDYHYSSHAQSAPLLVSGRSVKMIVRDSVETSSEPQPHPAGTAESTSMENGLAMCQVCSSNPADRFCQNCDDLLCHVCWPAQHARKKHHRALIFREESLTCAMCEKHMVKVACTDKDCGASLLCTHCDKDKHRGGLSSHVRMDLPCLTGKCVCRQTHCRFSQQRLDLTNQPHGQPSGGTPTVAAKTISSARKTHTPPVPGSDTPVTSNVDFTTHPCPKYKSACLISAIEDTSGIRQRTVKIELSERALAALVQPGKDGSAELTSELTSEKLRQSEKKVYTVGLFGNKDCVKSWLTRSKVTSDEDAAQLINSEPGLYILWSTSQIQYLYLQMAGHFTKNLASKSVNCRLIQFLIQLSDKILTFYSQSQVQMFDSTDHIDRPVQRLKKYNNFNEEPQTTEELRLLPGLTLDISSHLITECGDINIIDGFRRPLIRVQQKVTSRDLSTLALHTLKLPSTALSSNISAWYSEYGISIQEDATDETFEIFYQFASDETKKELESLYASEAWLKTKRTLARSTSLVKPSVNRLVACRYPLVYRLAMQVESKITELHHCGGCGIPARRACLLPCGQLLCSGCYNTLTGSCDRLTANTSSSACSSCPKCHSKFLLQEARGAPVLINHPVSVDAVNVCDQQYAEVCTTLEKQMSSPLLSSSPANFQDEITAFQGSAGLEHLLREECADSERLEECLVLLWLASKVQLWPTSSVFGGITIEKAFTQALSGDMSVQQVRQHLSPKLKQHMQGTAGFQETGKIRTFRLPGRRTIRKECSLPKPVELEHEDEELQCWEAIAGKSIQEIFEKHPSLESIFKKKSRQLLAKMEESLKKLLSSSPLSAQRQLKWASFMTCQSLLKQRQTTSSQPSTNMDILKISRHTTGCVEISFRKHRMQNCTHLEQFFTIESSTVGSSAKHGTDEMSTCTTHALKETKWNLPVNTTTQSLEAVFQASTSSQQVLAVVKEKGDNTSKWRLLASPLTEYKSDAVLPEDRQLPRIETEVGICDWDEVTRVFIFHDPSLELVVIYQFAYTSWQTKGVSQINLAGKGKLLQVRIIPMVGRVCILCSPGICYIYNILQHSHLEKEVDVSGAEDMFPSPDGQWLLFLVNPWRLKPTNQVPTSGSSGEKCAIKILSMEQRTVLPKIEVSDQIAPVFLCDPPLKMFMIGDELHLVGINQSKKCLVSCIVDIPGLSRSTILNTLAPSERMASGEDRKEFNYLDYFYHSYDKFPVSDTFNRSDREIDLVCVFDMDLVSLQQLKVDHLGTYLQDIMKGVKHKTQKPFGKFSITERQEAMSDSYVSSLHSCLLMERISARKIDVLSWVQKAICLVPVQIASVEGGSLKVLLNGNENKEVDEMPDVDGKQLCISFGLYEVILDCWKGKVKVVSSMGRQSLGKSYMLNHLTGSYFDSSGGRCTDGVWLTMHMLDECLLVVLDFEGLASSERTTEEDSLLSVFNAIVSGMTLFRTELNIDTHTVRMLEDFQYGVGMIQKDYSQSNQSNCSSNNILCGRFVLAVRDVDNRDILEGRCEIESKLRSLVNRCRRKAFLGLMYAKEPMIHSFPNINAASYYEELVTTKEHIMSKEMVVHATSLDFREILTVTMAKLTMKDWNDFSASTRQTRLRLLKTEDGHVITFGRQRSKPKLCTRSAEEIPDEPLAGSHGKQKLILDTGLPLDLSTEPCTTDTLQKCHGLSYGRTMNKAMKCLPTEVNRLSCKEERNLYAAILQDLYRAFSSGRNLKAEGTSIDDLEHQFQCFVSNLCNRRQKRVMIWIGSYLDDYGSQFEVEDFRNNVMKDFRRMQRDWQLCRQKCANCFYKCLLRSDHSTGSQPTEHNCLGKHECTGNCHFCPSADNVRHPCSLKAGHPHNHNCLKRPPHLCEKVCQHYGKPGCGRTCNKNPDHEHDKSSHDCCQTHQCGKECVAAGCSNHCNASIDGGPHLHSCKEEKCRQQCCFPGCHEQCRLSHVHHKKADDNTTTSQHWCEMRKHRCSGVCSLDGWCDKKLTARQRHLTVPLFTQSGKEIIMQVVTEETTYKSHCGIDIPSGQMEHDGPCKCNQERDHLCGEKCPSCGYGCELDPAHNREHTPHRTRHGAVTYTMAIPAQAQLQRQATAGTGVSRAIFNQEVADIMSCHTICKELGRGHIHLRKCTSEPCQSSEGKRHQSHFYTDSHGYEMCVDELSHEKFWETSGFEDPYLHISTEKKAEFNLCAAECLCKDHPSRHPQGRSFCKLPVLHNAASVKSVPSLTGHISKTGHQFACRHFRPVHHVLVADVSGSMGTTDTEDGDSTARVQALKNACSTYISKRKAVYPLDYVSLITFAGGANVIFRGWYPDVREDEMHQHVSKIEAGGDTMYYEVGQTINKISIVE